MEREERRRKVKLARKLGKAVEDLDSADERADMAEDTGEAMARRIAIEERKLLVAQRKLESIRLLDELLDRVKVKKNPASRAAEAG